MKVNLDNKKWLLNQLDGLIELNQSAVESERDLQTSNLPEAKDWILETREWISQNNYLINVIKNQLLRDYLSLLNENELEKLNKLL